MSSSRSTWKRTRTSRSSTTSAAESDDARTNFFAKLGKEGLADIEAVEIDWFAEAMQYSDLLAEAPDSVKGRWLDWKEAAATDGDGRLVGFGTDIGPQGICYRADLFEAAGLADRPRGGRRAVRRRLGELPRRRRRSTRQRPASR